MARYATKLQLHYMIFRAMRLLVALNTSKYDEGASREILRDLLGELKTPRKTTVTRPMAAGA
jgi:hypothetical protein